MRLVPKGFVVTYGDVARALRPPCNPRLVGWALRQAHPAARLPWHRVLAAGGRIALAGSHAMEQRLRLEAEGVRFRGRKVRMDLHHYKYLSRANPAASSE